MITVMNRYFFGIGIFLKTRGSFIKPGRPAGATIRQGDGRGNTVPVTTRKQLHEQCTHNY